MIRKLVFFFLLALLTGCYSLRPSIMLRTPKGYKYTPTPTTTLSEYKISPNDVLELKMYSNDGFKLIDFTSISSGSNVTINNINYGVQYSVEFDGTVKLPMLGRMLLKGLTIREAENLLEEKFSTYYNKPYVLLKVTNRRVIVFPGNEGTAKVVPLIHDNITLIEALATAGGIAQDGKARMVKLIRGDLKNPEVYLIDLSTIDGVKHADLVLQANDIIYVEPKMRIAKTFINEAAPYLTFFTSLFLVFTIIKSQK